METGAGVQAAPGTRPTSRCHHCSRAALLRSKGGPWRRNDKTLFDPCVSFAPHPAVPSPGSAARGARATSLCLTLF